MNRARRVVRTLTVARDYDVLHFAVCQIGLHILGKIIGVAVHIARFFVEYVRVVALIVLTYHIRRFLTADTCYRQSGGKRRGRAYRARIGIFCKVRTERTAVCRAVIVTCRANEADTRRLDGIVYLVEHHTFVVAVVRRRKAARRTQRHIDNVNADIYAVLQSRYDIFRYRTAQVLVVQIVGEYLTNNELCVGYNPFERFIDLFAVLVRIAVFVVAADNTRYVRTVVGVRGVYVCVVICVVVCKRHFIAHEHVACRCARTLGCVERNTLLFQIGKNVLYRRLVPSCPIGRFLVGVVRIVQARIQNSNERACTVTCIIARIVNTRIVYARLVGNVLRRGGGDCLRYGILGSDYYALYAVHLLDARNVLRVHLNSYRVEDGIIRVFERIRNTRFGQAL